MSKINEILENLFSDIQQIDWTIDNAMSFVDNLIDHAEAEIEAEISKRKEMWKKELLEKIEHCDKIYSSVNGEEDLIKKTQIKKLIKEA